MSSVDKIPTGRRVLGLTATTWLVPMVNINSAASRNAAVVSTLIADRLATSAAEAGVFGRMPALTRSRSEMILQPLGPFVAPSIVAPTTMQ